MDYYFIAKYRKGAFAGQSTLEEIKRKFHNGEIPGDYAVTESFGPSYAEILKLEVPWTTVAELVSNPPAQNERSASNQAPPHSTENKLPQTTANAPLLSGASKQAQTLSNRYGDAYLVARTTVGMGSGIKIIGILLGVLMCAGGFIIAVAFSEAAGKGNDAIIFISILTIVGGFGIFAGALLFLQGILISAQGQTLKASLDSAVNNSPFLSNEQRAKIMSLPVD